ncbi:MAG: hypothetical protein WAJ85_10095 [Candidatus Baltobacteraceae bacterium]
MIDFDREGQVPSGTSAEPDARHLTVVPDAPIRAGLPILAGPMSRAGLAAFHEVVMAESHEREARRLCELRGPGCLCRRCTTERNLERRDDPSLLEYDLDDPSFRAAYADARAAVEEHLEERIVRASLWGARQMLKGRVA